VRFASDNNAGVCPEVLAAILAEAERSDAAYGWDQASARLEQRLSEVFEHPVLAVPVATGTAANALALAFTNPVWGGVLCHQDAHILVDECAAPTVLGGGLTLVGTPGPNGRLSVQGVEDALADRRDSGVHTVPVTGLSLTQSSEAGTRYPPGELAALGELARRHAMRVHMDGARFANAVAAAGTSPAELSWRAGVDVLTLGATKDGALAAEVIVVFADDLRRRGEELERLRKRSGHLLSKQRFLSAQLEAWLLDGAWLRHADHANTLAADLAQGLRSRGVEVLHPVEANMVFALLSSEQHQAAQAAGAVYYTERPRGRRAGEDRVEARLVTSWSSTMSEVDEMIRVIGSA
jgi:threonine aldolase